MASPGVAFLGVPHRVGRILPLPMLNYGFGGRTLE